MCVCERGVEQAQLGGVSDSEGFAFSETFLNLKYLLKYYSSDLLFLFFLGGGGGSSVNFIGGI